MSASAVIHQSGSFTVRMAPNGRKGYEVWREGAVAATRVAVQQSSTERLCGYCGCRESKHSKSDGPCEECAAMPSSTTAHQKAWHSFMPDDGDDDVLPPCVLTMRCYCAGHARGNPASEPCDTSEHANCGDRWGNLKCALVRGHSQHVLHTDGQGNEW